MPKQREDDIIIYLIVILSILIETFIDAIKCLILITSSASTPAPTKSVTLSSNTKPTSSGSIKSQRSSPSTKPRSTTGVLKKEDGGTKQDTPVLPTASSPRSKRSRSTSSTQTSTKSGTSRTSASQRRPRTTKSTSPTTTPSPTPKNVLITADEKDTGETTGTENQSA
jgi:hypothetical protein